MEQTSDRLRSERDTLLAELNDIVDQRGELWIDLNSKSDEIAHLLAERQKDQETISKLQKDVGRAFMGGVNSRFVDVEAERDSALAALRQVRLDVEAAAHESFPDQYGDPECNSIKHSTRGKGPCNCFKARILPRIDAALLSEQGSLDGETPQAKAELDVLAVPEEI